MAIPILSADEIERHLTKPLAPVLSLQRTIHKPAIALSTCSAKQQQFVLHWSEIVARTNAEMSFQFVFHAPTAIEKMPLVDVEAWITDAMDCYEHQGLFAGIKMLEQVETFAHSALNTSVAVDLEEVAGMLAIYLNGLAGRRLNISDAELAHTDTETVYLPARINRFTSPELNRLLYKAAASYLWAQTWYGSFRIDAAGHSLAERLESYENPKKAVALFGALENIRLHACIQRDLPGLYRHWQTLQQEQGVDLYPPHWSKYANRLRQTNATASTSLEIVPEVLGDTTPEFFCYQGKVLAEKVADVMAIRIKTEKAALQSALLELLNEASPASEKEENRTVANLDQVAITGSSSKQPDGSFDIEISIAGQSIGIPPELAALLQSILQDLGSFPSEYLVAAGDNDYEAQAMLAGISSDETSELKDSLFYPEWDHVRHHYRNNWCTLKELDVEPVDEPFIADTLNKYHGEMQHLRKAFEALLGEDRVMKRQPDGDDVDFDAVVAAMTDLDMGREMPTELFTRVHRHERNIAVMFMVDMSGSTKGWVNDAEREALVLLCQALEILGDRYAIYGFSGMTRKRCDLYRVKQFDEPYSTEVEQRITGIKAQDYTRMGVTIRHLSKLLNEVDARTKLLITLSDGKPDDFDGYRGEYGIEDTRKALIEAKQQGIHSFCITIDDEARDYLPHMYGAVNYTIINDVRKLPLKVAEVYRRLTI
ncbi:MAG: nitric oxide reductase activation protein NorD [Acidiferrobacterales bacterium]